MKHIYPVKKQINTDRLVNECPCGRWVILKIYKSFDEGAPRFAEPIDRKIFGTCECGMIFVYPSPYSP